jgi:hypothetical protein
MGCLAELESDSANASTERKRKDLHAHMFDMLDPTGLDSKTLTNLNESENKVMVANQCILDLLMEGTQLKILDASPPILSRAFQELGTGMTGFHEALKFKDAPFPEPFVIVGDILLLIHSVLTPFAMILWTENIFAASFFSFIICFAFWSLHYIAEELDNPFNNPEVDFDAKYLYDSFNSRLLALSWNSVACTPSLSPNAQNLLTGKVMSMSTVPTASFHAMHSHTMADAVDNVHFSLKLLEASHDNYDDVQAPPSCSTSSTTHHATVSLTPTDDSDGKQAECMEERFSCIDLFPEPDLSLGTDTVVNIRHIVDTCRASLG